MKILVTGAYGQLGSEINELSEQFPEWQFKFTDIDLLDITSEIAVHEFMKKNRPDFLINCAAYTAVDKAETDKVNAQSISRRLAARFRVFALDQRNHGHSPHSPEMN